MSSNLVIGAVAYDPKVVTIWEGMREYFRSEAKLDAEIVLFLSYEAQVDALLRGTIDVAWNTNLAFVQAEKWSEGACRPLAMRDTDLAWRSLLIAPKGGAITSLEGIRGKTIALGSRDSGHAAILPVHYLAEQGLVEGRDYTTVRFNTDLGKHGDTGTSEIDVLKAVAEGRVDAGFVGSPFWEGVHESKIVPAGALEAVWKTPEYPHCMFTARRGLDEAQASALVLALEAMDFENPKHRPVLVAEGLKRWVRAAPEGYASLRSACEKQGFFALKR